MENVLNRGEVRTFRLSRRQFVAGTLAAAVTPGIVPASALGLDNQLAPSERITIGILGTGNRGTDSWRAMRPLPDHQVVAIADCRRDRALLAQKNVNDYYAGRVGKRQFQGCDIYNDFRELLARKDIDAVWGCVPDHWHGVVYSRAIEAGKDIYGEKPITRWIADGIKVRNAVRRYGCVFQTGTMQRSWRQFRQACELAINGYLGKVHTIQVGAGRDLLSGRAALPSTRGVRLRHVDRPGALHPVRQETVRVAGHVHDFALLCRVHHQLGRPLSGHRRLGLSRGLRQTILR